MACCIYAAHGRKLHTHPGGLRLHHHRRRHGRVRAGQPAERRSAQPRAVARGRRARPAVLGERPDRLPLHPGQAAHGLVLLDRSGAGAGRAGAQIPPRQAARRLFLDQRHDLHARPGRRLRPLASARAGRLGLGRCPALFPQVGGPLRRSERDARRRGPAQGRAPAARLADPRRLPCGGCRMWYPVHGRFQPRR